VDVTVCEGGVGRVSEKNALVLVSGIGKIPFEDLAPVLDRQKLEVVKIAAPENTVELAQSEPFDLIIFGTEIKQGTLEQVVDAIRQGISASRNTSILVLARPKEVDAVQNLIGRGVNRVMLLNDSPDLIGQQVAELLNIAPRANLRFSTRLQTSVADGGVEILGEIVNMSSTGILVETEKSFKPCQQVVVTINLGGQKGPVTAKAEVVRLARNDRGGIEGVGLHFLSFAGDGKEKIEAVLDEAFTETPIN
jgi:hypothetical protein